MSQEKNFVKIRLEKYNSLGKESLNKKIIDEFKLKKLPISKEEKNSFILSQTKSQRKTTGCSCIKQKCTNFKCKCFKKNIFCFNCDCIDCNNNIWNLKKEPEEIKAFDRNYDHKEKNVL